MIVSDHLVFVFARESILHNAIYFSHALYSLLCLYYTGFFKKSLSDYCVKTRRISEIFRNFFVFISDSCYFALAAHSASQFFVQFFSAISRYFQKNHAKNSLFDNFITNQRAVYLISAFRFWFPPQESAIFLFQHRLFCFCLLCFVEFFFDSPQNRRVSCILFASFGCKSKHLFARC